MAQVVLVVHIGQCAACERWSARRLLTPTKGELMAEANPVHTTTFAAFDFVVAMALALAGSLVIAACLI